MMSETVFSGRLKYSARFRDDSFYRLAIEIIIILVIAVECVRELYFVI